MALDTTNLSRIGQGTNSVWMYHTTDAIATVVTDDYFFDAGTAPADGEDIRDSIRTNDVIMVVGATGGTHTVDLCVVDLASSTTITVTNGT